MTDTTPPGTWDDAMRQLERYVRERNEARRERDDLAEERDAYAADMVRAAIVERDEARAELERLREAARFVLLYGSDDGLTTLDYQQIEAGTGPFATLRRILDRGAENALEAKLELRTRCAAARRADTSWRLGPPESADE